MRQASVQQAFEKQYEGKILTFVLLLGTQILLLSINSGKQVRIKEVKQFKYIC